MTYALIIYWMMTDGEHHKPLAEHLSFAQCTSDKAALETLRGLQPLPGERLACETEA